MAKYFILLSKTARKQLDKLPDAVSEELLEVIASLADNPRPYGYKNLKGRNGFRIRKGDYRIIYDILDNILTVNVIAIGHRKDIYE